MEVEEIQSVGEMIFAVLQDRKIGPPNGGEVGYLQVQFEGSGKAENMVCKVQIGHKWIDKNATGP